MFSSLLLHTFRRTTPASITRSAKFFAAAEIPLLVRTASTAPSFKYEPQSWPDTGIARGRGLNVLHDPVFNKGTAHPLIERERLGLRGLLPAKVLTMEEQLARSIDRYYNSAKDWLSAEEEHIGGISHDDLRKWHILQELQDRNETLFYRLIADNFVEMAPVIYTPVVGHVCKYYHKLYRRPRGMTFSAADRGEMATMVYNWPSECVDAIVVTDGSRILGLGDLGANGLGIPIGKLDIYVAAGGFDPGRVLPCVIDVGTNNEDLRNDEWYLGLRQPRLTGDTYYEVIDEFVKAVMGRWPNAVLQFEDFSTDHAQTLLNRYRDYHCVFNDDVQGTAATAVGGLIGAMQVQGKGPEALADQKFVVVGAGSAGMGVVSVIAQSMVKHGLSPGEAEARFHILDAEGLITSDRAELPPHVARFARKDGDSRDGESLLEVINRTHPTALIGLSGAGRLFTSSVLELMGKVNHRPIIMAMSNPTSKMECTHEEAQAATGGRAIFACGSPQPDVTIDGRVCGVSQANNMYVFAGLAFGAMLANGNVVSDHMLIAAAEALPGMITEEEVAQGRVYPDMNKIREISLHVACEVIKAAADEGHVNNSGVVRALSHGEEELHHYVHSHMWSPRYRSLVAPGPSPLQSSHRY